MSSTHMPSQYGKEYDALLDDSTAVVLGVAGYLVGTLVTVILCAFAGATGAAISIVFSLILFATINWISSWMLDQVKQRSSGA